MPSAGSQLTTKLQHIFLQLFVAIIPIIRINILQRRHNSQRIASHVMHSLLTCWIVLKIIKDIFTSCIISWILLNRTPDSQWSNPTCRLCYTVNTILLMPWLLKSPGHQQAWYWPPNPEYSVSSIRRVNMKILLKHQAKTKHCLVLDFGFWEKTNIFQPSLT